MWVDSRTVFVISLEIYYLWWDMIHYLSKLLFIRMRESYRAEFCRCALCGLVCPCPNQWCHRWCLALDIWWETPVVTLIGVWSRGTGQQHVSSRLIHCWFNLWKNGDCDWFIPTTWVWRVFLANWSKLRGGSQREAKWTQHPLWLNQLNDFQCISPLDSKWLPYRPQFDPHQLEWGIVNVSACF